MRRAFTLIELLVVISIIALLIAILLPALGQARFSAKVTQCSVNFRQWGVAAHAYAVDNNGQLPTSNLPGVSGSNPWDNGPLLVQQLQPYMDNYLAWFCPVTMEDHLRHAEEGLGRSISSMDDLDEALRARYGFVWLYYNYFVPRQDGTGEWFPVINNYVGNPDGWPRTLDDKRGLDQPIASDQVRSLPNGTVEDIINGHHKGGKFFSMSVLYMDGHVDIRTRDLIEPRYEGNWVSWY